MASPFSGDLAGERCNELLHETSHRVDHDALYRVLDVALRDCIERLTLSLNHHDVYEGRLVRARRGLGHCHWTIRSELPANTSL